jgi:hypothetical protein
MKAARAEMRPETEKKPAGVKSAGADADRIVNEEHVICSNCYYQFSFLYEGKQDVPADPPHQVLHAPPKETAKARMQRYRSLDEAVHPCPNCEYVQPWMVSIGRSIRVRTAVSVTLGLLCLNYLACAYLTKFSGIMEHGLEWAIPLGIFILMAGALGVYHSLRIWDPNGEVDQQSFGGAARVGGKPEIPAGTETNWFSLVPVEGTQNRKARKLARGAACVAVAAGAMVFALPLVSESAAYHLERMNAVMLPFWAGIVLMTFGVGTAVGLGVKGRFDLRRQPSEPVADGAAGKTEQSG